MVCNVAHPFFVQKHHHPPTLLRRIPKGVQPCAPFRSDPQGCATLRSLFFCLAVRPVFLCTSPEFLDAFTRVRNFAHPFLCPRSGLKNNNFFEAIYWIQRISQHFYALSPYLQAFTRCANSRTRVLKHSRRRTFPIIILAKAVQLCATFYFRTWRQDQ